MKFPKDQELFENVSEDGKLILPPSIVEIRNHPHCREIIEFDNIRHSLMMQSLSYNVELKELFTKAGQDTAKHQKMAMEGKRELLESQHKQVEKLFRSDYISGFLYDHYNVLVGTKSVDVDYFDEHPIRCSASQETVCDGAFHRLNSILSSFIHKTIHPFCFLLSLAAAYMLSTCQDGRLTFLACAVMVISGIVLFFTDFEEDVLSKWICSIFCKIAVAALSVLAIASSLSSSTMIAVPVMYYYIVAAASMLVDFGIQLLKQTRNWKTKKAFCKTFEACAQDIHRYVRYHVLWWQHNHPGEVLHPSIESMNRSLEMYTRMYKKYR